MSLIVCGEDPEEAQKLFEEYLHSGSKAENSIHIEIKRIVAAQFMDQLFVESGQEPIDWPQISQRIESTLESDADNLEQGYWADANQLVRPEKLSADLASLRQDLPEDIRSGLNWSADRQFFFILSVLGPPLPPAPPVDPVDETEFDTSASDEEPAESQAPQLDVAEAALPELADKEVAALVLARNSVAAAWLWRKFAALTQFAANEIDIDPPCGIAGFESQMSDGVGDED